jgi:single-strand DNA-binding protein
VGYDELLDHLEATLTTSVSLIGNVTREPELKFLPSGVPLCEFGMAINTRRKEGDKWVDGDPEFYDVTCWREMAENVAESISKGMRVVVLGRLNFRTWENDAGEKRSKISVNADEVSPSLRWATVQVTRTERHDGGGGYRANTAASTDDEEPF